MGRSLIRLTDPRDGSQHLFEWSSAVDAPVVSFRDDIHAAAYYRDEYGRRWFAEQWERFWADVEATGTSSGGYSSAESQVLFNRAGEGETCLSLEELIDKYRWVSLEKLIDEYRGKEEADEPDGDIDPGTPR